MAYQPPPQLTPSSLFEEQARLDAMRLATYNKLLAAVHQKIKFIANQNKSNTMTHFDVPDWQPGCPRYDVKDCILYIVWNLRNSGFNVIYMSPNRLLINWQEESLRYYQEESPIRQAMMAAATAPPPPTGRNAGEKKPTERKKPSAYKPPADSVVGLLAGGGSNGSRRGGSNPNTITFI
jgi:hypothetical protein